MQNSLPVRDATTWRLQDAKAQFSELVNSAMRGVPQHVTRSGKPAVVVLSEQEFERLRYNAAHLVNDATSLVDHLINIPKSATGAEDKRVDPLDFSRITVRAREVDLS